MSARVQVADGHLYTAEAMVSDESSVPTVVAVGGWPTLHHLRSDMSIWIPLQGPDGVRPKEVPSTLTATSEGTVTNVTVADTRSSLIATGGLIEPAMIVIGCAFSR